MNKKEPVLQSNKKLIYSWIAEHGPISKAELLDAFSLTSSTLTRMLEEMTSEGLIQAASLGASSGGRRPILYQIEPDYKYIFGLEISRFSSTLGLFDMAMNPKSVMRWRMDESMTPERFVEFAAGHMRSFLKDHQLEPSQILGIGIGAVGPVDRNKGTILDPLYFPASGWRNIPICQQLENATGWKAYLENGVNAALIGEAWAMRDQGIQHALYVHAGVSLRSAIMSQGQIVHGTVDTEGSIGQMIVHMDGQRLAPIGNYGALEAYASIQALERTARSQAKAGRALGPLLSPLSPDRIQFEHLLKALDAEDPFAREIFEQSAVYFGIGLANLINMFHPEIVILGGTLVNYNSLYFDTATHIARKNTFYYPRYEPVFSKGNLKEDAVITGCALNVCRAFQL